MSNTINMKKKLLGEMQIIKKQKVSSAMSPTLSNSKQVALNFLNGLEKEDNKSDPDDSDQDTHSKIRTVNISASHNSFTTATNRSLSQASLDAQIYEKKIEAVIETFNPDSVKK